MVNQYLDKAREIIRAENVEVLPLTIPLFQKAIAAEPDRLEIYLEWARVHHRLGQEEMAWQRCDEALARRPGWFAAQCLRMFMQVPVLCRDEDHLSTSRRRYAQHLAALLAEVEASPKLLTAPGQVLEQMWMTSFFLQYHALDDLALQQQYGELLRRVSQAAHPQYATPPVVRPPEPGAPVRVGIVSPFLRQHSIWKDITKGWISGLDPDQIELFCYYLSSKTDGETGYAQAVVPNFVAGSRSVDEWAQVIRQDRLHVAIFPQVSMNARSVQLGLMRLAPIQCANWAAYVTTGLPTIDYFLSGDSLEPPDGEIHYSEKLMHLPNLGISYAPLALAPGPETREDLGLRDGAILFFSAQTPFKFLPQYDSIFPRIAGALAERDVDCQFIFRRSRITLPMMKRFIDRLSAAFARFGLDAERYISVQPFLLDGAFHALYQHSDVFLDTIGVSGATTTLEILPYCVPIVTLPGRFLRGRVSGAILARMGIDETIATDVEEYIDIAIRLATDDGWRAQMQARIRENRHKVYFDRAAIDGLQEFLLAVARDPAAYAATNEAAP